MIIQSTAPKITEQLLRLQLVLYCTAQLIFRRSRINPRSYKYTSELLGENK